MSEKEFNAIFAKNLKYYLELHKMTQRELAEKIGVVESTISVWCKGKKTPRMDKIDMICNLFSIARTDLITDHDIEDKNLLEKMHMLNSFGRKQILKQIDYALTDKDYVIDAYNQDEKNN